MVLGSGADDGESPEVRDGPGSRSVAFRQDSTSLDSISLWKFPDVNEESSKRPVVKGSPSLNPSPSSSTFASGERSL